jgi:multidrug efflux pump subunit AcrB
VLQTVVAEVYGPDAAGRRHIADQILKIFEGTEGIVDVDWYVEEQQPKYEILVNKDKAALHGVSDEHIAGLMRIASAGDAAGLLHDENEKEDVPIQVRLARAARSDLGRLQQLRVRGRDGSLIPLAELVRVEQTVQDRSIYHKNLMPVTYVTADLAGAIESPVYAVLETSPLIEEIKAPEG